MFGISTVFLTFTITQALSGNGFLALYLCGMILGNKTYRYHKSFVEFYNSMAWVMQITMFLTLGLLVNPNELPHVFWESLGICLCLMFLARPLAVTVCLWKSDYTFKEKIFVFWAGLKGAVPIILATYPMMAGYAESQYLFDLIFFLVVLSVLIQGKTLPLLADKLGLADENKEPPENGDGAFSKTDLKAIKENIVDFSKETADELMWFFGKLKARGFLLFEGLLIKKKTAVSDSSFEKVEKSPTADDDKTDAGE